jgi:hypothetical protein
MTSTKTAAATGPLPDEPERISAQRLKFGLWLVFTEDGLADWSLLTILLVSNGALCSHEGERETGARGSLSYLWREARRKM